jgi:two-component system response regulator LytT
MTAIKIGIVEDEGITSEVIKISLQKLNYKVATPAFSYDQAISMVNTENPDLVLIDINLGEEKDGIDLAAVLKDEYNKPFIFLTANSDAATIARAKKVKPLAFLVKPFSQVDLHAAIEIAFHNYQSKLVEEANFVIMKVGRTFEKINTAEILFLENENHYFNIRFTKGENISVRASTSEILNLLPTANFIKISRSFIVNATHISKIDNSGIYLGDYKLEYNISLRKDILSMIN